MLAGTEENDLSSIKLGLCPSQNNFSLDSDGLDTAESPTHHHHHHHPINSAIGEDVEHKNDTQQSHPANRVPYGLEAMPWLGQLCCLAPGLTAQPLQFAIKRTTSLFKDVYRDLPQPRAPPTASHLNLLLKFNFMVPLRKLELLLAGALRKLVNDV